jgi:hypothetical protein
MRLRSAVTAISAHVRGIALAELSVIASFPKLFGIPARPQAGENSSCEPQSAM